MGCIVSCITGIFQCIGDCIMAIIGMVAGCLECIVAAIASCLAGIANCLTCGACRTTFPPRPQSGLTVASALIKINYRFDHGFLA
ncbi:hypothetical protein B0H12DRAFT_305877 [Mycena haematopus]|nr:hypothetical protein B0H12DRAFT_305877 [Mycena haematopus]